MKARMIIVSSIVTLVVILLIYFIYTNKGNKYQWYQNYRGDNIQPYGTQFIEKLLASSHTGKTTVNQKQPIHKVLEGIEWKNTDYVLVGQSIHLDDKDRNALVNFIGAGNDVFISTMEAPTSLVNSLYTSQCEDFHEFTYEYNMDTAVFANFYDSTRTKSADYEFRYRMGAEDYPYYWRTLDNQVLCDTTQTMQLLGYQQSDLVNFIKIPYNSGNLYLHTSPLMFTNYFMTKRHQMEYASTAFSYLNGKDLIWDEVSKVPFSDMDNPYDSPLYYIMQQPALKYAWWMLLAAALLYVIFASKRTQRIIPFLETKSNTSLEFLNVISSLHYQNPDHLDMARKKMKYFLYFIRARYGINTQSLTEEQSKRLSEKSKVDLPEITIINDRYRSIENYAITDDDPDLLVNLYHSIENFYKKCK
jgi:hypothetical protein